MIALFLFACVHRPPPSLYPVALEAPAEAPAPELPPPSSDACLEAAPFLPGQAPPFTRAGLATCRAVVIPERWALELEAEADAGDYWRGISLTCHQGRSDDRGTCDQAVGDLVDARDKLERRAAITRVAWPVSLVLTAVGASVITAVAVDH